MIEAEKQKFVVTINERLERMIRDVVITKVKERVKTQVGSRIEAQRKFLFTLSPKGIGTCSALSEDPSRKQRSFFAKSTVPHQRVSCSCLRLSSYPPYPFAARRRTRMPQFDPDFPWNVSRRSIAPFLSSSKSSNPPRIRRGLDLLVVIIPRHPQSSRNRLELSSNFPYPIL